MTEETKMILDEMKSMREALENKIKEEISGVKTELKEEISGVKTELKEEISGVKAELEEEISGVKAELKEEISGVKAELKEEISGVRKEFQEKFEDNNKQMETIRFILENETRDSIRLVAEGHQDLYRKMEEILKVNNEKEIMFIRLKYLESEVRLLKDKLDIA